MWIGSHPKIARTAEAEARPDFPVWFRLCRLRAVEGQRGHQAAAARGASGTANPRDAGDGAQDLDRRSKGLDLAVDLLIDLSDGRVNRVDMLEQKTQHKAMMVGD